jgi:hypothetical protein
LKARIVARFLLPKITTSLYPADVSAVLIAASLPWSTSLPAIFVGLWLLALIPITDIQSLLQLAKRPVCLLPVAFFLLALVGTLWSHDLWSTRLYYIGPLAKLLAIPLFIYHFQRSPHGTWIFAAFLASCTLLMLLSWTSAIEPRLVLKSGAYYGVPVKNYIDQSQEFALCTVGLAYVIMRCQQRREMVKAGLLLAVAAGFLSNMIFIVVSRTALVTMPVMLGVFAFLYLTPRNILICIGVSLTLVIVMWFASPNLRGRTEMVITQYQQYEASDEPTSIGLRLEFWKKSMRFFGDAPVIGHGTGSVRSLFAQSAAHQTGASAEVVANPHNQTLYVAVQWGTVGVVVLYAMWLSHLLLFRGTSLMHWVGLLVVAQNMTSSLFNSHLFDFHEGWMYVIGVGVAGGAVISSQTTTSIQDHSSELSS